jgi:hypothetical protein
MSTSPASRFAFVVNRGPVLRGGLLGAGLLCLGFGWAFATGRVQAVDWSFAAVVIGSIVLVPPFVVFRMLSGSAKAAAALGQLEVDDLGARWVRPDSTFGFDLRWADVERATFDDRNSTVVLFRREGGSAILGVLGQHGVPAGNVVIERFGELVERVRARVPTTDHWAEANVIAAKENTRVKEAGDRALKLGALSCLVAALVYGANLAVAAQLHWKRFLVAMPVFIAVVGAITLLAGFKIRSGKGPQVSPLYAPGYPATIYRFLAVATVANGVLVAMLNLVR